jgi:hypothetical protein
MPGIAVPGASSSSASTSGPTPAQAAAAQALLDAQNAKAAAAQKILDDAAAAQKLIDDAAAAAASAGAPPASPSAGGLAGLASAAASLFGYGTKPPPPPIAIPGASGISTVIAPVSPTGGMGAAGGVIVGEHPEITAAKIKAGTQKDLTIVQNKELLANLYDEYPEIFATELSSIKTPDPFKTWISKPDKDKTTTKNLVQELLISKNELLAARAVQAAQEEEDWRLKKIRIMKQTRDEIGSGFAPKIEKYRKEEEAKAIAKKAAEDAAAEAAAEAALDAKIKAKADKKAKKEAEERRKADLKKLRGRSPGGAGAAGGKRSSSK